MSLISRLRSLARSYVPPPLKPALRPLAVGARQRYRDWRYGARFFRAWARNPSLHRTVRLGLRDPRLEPDLRALLVRLLLDRPKGHVTDHPVIPEHAARPDVLYVSNRLSPDALKDIVALGSSGGLRVTLLCSADLETEANVRGVPSPVVFYRNPLELVACLVRFEAPVTMARRGSTAESVLSRLFGPGRFVYRPHDFVDREPTNPAEAEFRKLNVQHRAERFILRTADALSHIHDEVAIRTLRTEYEFHGPDVFVRPGCLPAFEAPRETPRLSDADGHVHIVHALVHAHRLAATRGAQPSSPLEDLERLLRQGLHLHLYDGTRSDGPADTFPKDLQELAARYPSCHLHAAPPYAELVRELSQYDVAFSYFPKRRARQLDRFLGPLLTGFYTYLDAGLPVVTSPDNWQMADLVQRHQIGIVLPPADIDRLAQVLHRTQLEPLRENVQRARPSLRHESERLSALVRSMAGLPPIAPSATATLPQVQTETPLVVGR